MADYKNLELITSDAEISDAWMLEDFRKFVKEHKKDKLWTSDTESNGAEFVEKYEFTFAWGSGICNVHANAVWVFNDFEIFFEAIKMMPKGSVVYYHNIKWDYCFIIPYLHERGFHQCKANRKSGKPEDDYGYSTIISDLGMVYQVAINFGDTWVIMKDSLKLIGGTLKKICKDLKIEELGKRDEDEEFYDRIREVGHIMDVEERSYLAYDCVALSEVVKVLEEIGMTKKLTSSSFAFDQLKDFIFQKYNDLPMEDKHYYTERNNYFREIFPALIKYKTDDEGNILYNEDNEPIEIFNYDKELRKSYKGGICYVGAVEDKIYNDHIYVYDYNSLYPSVMVSPYEYPYGMPEIEYELPEDNLYIVTLFLAATVKPKHIPFLSLRNSGVHTPSNFIEDTEGIIEITLTSVDYKLMHEHYDVTFEEIKKVYVFKSRVGMFDDFVYYFYNMKEEASKDGNVTKKLLAKSVLNGSTGKWATRPAPYNCKIEFDEEEVMRIVTADKDYTNIGQYVPITAFITSYGRRKLLDAIMLNRDNWLYCDTDSLHLNAPIIGCEVDPFKLGYLDCEEDDIDMAVYSHQKTYIEHRREPKKGVSWIIKACGCPDRCKEEMLNQYGDDIINEFHHGFSIEGKKQQKKVKGGVILKPTNFTIK